MRSCKTVGQLALLYTLAILCSTALAQQPDIEVGIYHPLECLISGDFEATVYVYNRSKKEQFYVGEVAAEDGTLVLSGDWNLILEKVKDGKVVSSKPLGPNVRGASQRYPLPGGEDRSWKPRISVKELVQHPGNYRFRVSQGPHSQTGRLFRIVERRGAPESISLTYTSDKSTYFLGGSRIMLCRQKKLRKLLSCNDLERLSHTHRTVNILQIHAQNCIELH